MVINMSWIEKKYRKTVEVLFLTIRCFGTQVRTSAPNCHPGYPHDSKTVESIVIIYYLLQNKKYLKVTNDFIITLIYGWWTWLGLRSIHQTLCKLIAFKYTNTKPVTNKNLLQLSLHSSAPQTHDNLHNFPLLLNNSEDATEVSIVLNKFCSGEETCLTEG